MQRLRPSLLLFILICLTASCQTVKPYQRIYLNDMEMQLNKDITGKFEEKVQDIREGATPPGGTYKTSGCGCN